MTDDLLTFFEAINGWRLWREFPFIPGRYEWRLRGGKLARGDVERTAKGFLIRGAKAGQIVKWRKIREPP